MRRFRVSLSFGITALLLAATLIADSSLAKRISEPLAEPLARIDSELLGWKAVKDEALTAGVLRELAPTDYLSRTYKKGAMQADVFAAYYAQQRAGESMHSPKHCLPGAGWEIWKHGSSWVEVPGGRAKINMYSIEHSGNRMLMFYWYQSRGRIVADEYLAKVLLARDTLMTGRTAGSIVRVMLPDTPGAEQQGAALSAALVRQMQRCFGAPDAPLAQ